MSLTVEDFRLSFADGLEPVRGVEQAYLKPTSVAADVV